MKYFCLFLCVMFPAVSQAENADFTVSAAREIRDTGFLQHLLPRFSLKHGVRITQVDESGDVVIGGQGVPVFTGLDKVWSVTGSKTAGAELFVEWLLSDIGKRTIESFKPDSVAIFTTQFGDQTAETVLVFDGDPVQGEALSLTHCGRCHVINETNRMKGMGQTPSLSPWNAQMGTSLIFAGSMKSSVCRRPLPADGAAAAK